MRFREKKREGAKGDDKVEIGDRELMQQIIQVKSTQFRAIAE